jgi:hypothetical protein
VPIIVVFAPEPRDERRSQRHRSNRRRVDPGSHPARLGASAPSIVPQSALPLCADPTLSALRPRIRSHRRDVPMGLDLCRGIIWPIIALPIPAVRSDDLNTLAGISDFACRAPPLGPRTAPPHHPPS